MVTGADGAPSDRGRAADAGPAAARLETCITRAPTVRAASATARVPSAFTAAYSSSLALLTTPARWTTASTSANARRSAVLSRSARTTVTPGGGWFVEAGRTI